MPRAVLPVAMTLFVAVASFAPAADWPHFYGLNRDGHSTETGFNWTWGKDGPPIAWTMDIGAGFAGVTVSGGSLFLFHRIDNEEILTALDTATGKLKWKFAATTKYTDDFGFDNGPRCVPIVADGRVFTLGANGDLHAIDATKGDKLWHRNIVTDYAVKKGFFGVGAGPVVVGDKLLVNVGGKGAGIVAFDVSTGKELWKATDDPPSYSSANVMTLDGKPHGVIFTRSGLVVVEAATGKVKFTKPWRARLEASVNAASPVVRGGEILLTTSYGTGAILLKAKGTELNELWSNDRSISCHYNTPVLVDDYLYGIDGRAEGRSARLRCADWKTGDVKWSVDRFGCASLIAVDGGLLAITESGELVRFAATEKAFQELSRAKVLTGITRAAPALADGRLFVRDETKLVCVKLK